MWVDVDATALWELRESSRDRDRRRARGCWPTSPGSWSPGCSSTPCSTPASTPSAQEIVESTRSTSASPCRASAASSSRPCSARDAMTTAPARRRDPPASPRRRARAGATAEELAAGTFTLNNYGSFSVDGSAAIINHPQVAILGFGRILDRPWVVDGEIVRPQDHPDVASSSTTGSATAVRRPASCAPSPTPSRTRRPPSPASERPSAVLSAAVARSGPAERGHLLPTSQVPAVDRRTANGATTRYCGYLACSRGSAAPRYLVIRQRLSPAARSSRPASARRTSRPARRRRW